MDYKDGGRVYFVSGGAKRAAVCGGLLKTIGFSHYIVLANGKEKWVPTAMWGHTPAEAAKAALALARATQAKTEKALVTANTKVATLSALLASVEEGE